MRLSGITAALGTFVILVIGNVVFTNWEKGTGGAPGLSGIPQTGIWTILSLRSLRRDSLRVSADDMVSDGYARRGKMRSLRERSASGSDESDSSLSCCLRSSSAIAGVAFGQAQQGIFPNAFYLEATFVTLAMLVVGGMRSLTGAVVGAIALSALAEGLSRLQNGVTVAGVGLDIPDGSQQVGFALAMLVVLLLRPGRSNGGRELTLRTPRARAVE